MPADGFATITLKDERLNGLKLKAKLEGRSVSNMIDRILDQAGIPELTDKELEKKMEATA